MKALLVYPSESHAGNFIWAKPYIYPQSDLDESIEKLRKKGYLVSMFPECDGLAFTSETISDRNEIYFDFKDSFNWIKILPKTTNEDIDLDQLWNEQIVIMPLMRFMIYEPILTGNFCVFPPGHFNTQNLNPSSIDIEFFSDSKNKKSGRDHITEFTGFSIEKIEEYPIIVFRNSITPAKFFSQNQIEDREMIKELSQYADEFLDVVRFYNCDYTVPEGLPSKAGIWNDRYSVALLYFPKYGKIFFQSREVEIKNYVRGVGIELLDTEIIEKHPLLKSEIGETGKIIKNAIRMNSEILESDNETMKFANIFALFEFLGYPFGYKKFKDLKKNIICTIVENKRDYHNLCTRFEELTGGKGAEIGLRTEILHLGKNLIELVPDYEKRRELFKELEQYVVLKISDMIKHSNLSWSEYEEVLDNRFKEIMK